RALGFLCLGKGWPRGTRCRPPAPGGGATPSSGAAPQGFVRDSAGPPARAAQSRCPGRAAPRPLKNPLRL
ncbi:unnamed protein product, partial [Bubo scandiacus]